MIREQTRRRNSNRAEGYDYRSSGFYFVTCCVLNRELLFGDVEDDRVLLNSLGQIVEDEWLRTARVRSNVTVDSLVVMPNHVHAILGIEWEGPSDADRATQRVAPTSAREGLSARGAKADSLGAIVGQIKSASSKRINAEGETPGVPIWQRGFHDRIIRTNDELIRIRSYLESNPANWMHDQENPIVPRRGDALRRPA